MLNAKSLGNMPYWEVEQSGFQPDTPIVVALHYMTGDANALLFMFKDFPKPLRVITLQGRYPLGEAGVGGYSWFPDEEPFYDQSEAEQAPDIRAEADRIADFLRELKGLYPAKVAVTGMSQGGDLSLSLAVYHPQVIDMALPLAGRLSTPMRPARVDSPQKPKVFMKVGTDDHIVSVESSREAREWLQGQGYTAELREYPGVGHDISAAMVADIQGVLDGF